MLNLLLVFSFIFALACHAGNGSVSAIKVNDVKISKAQFLIALKAATERYDPHLIKIESNHENLKRRVTEDLIIEQVLIEEAAHRGIIISQDVIWTELHEKGIDFAEGSKKNIQRADWIERTSRRLLAQKMKEILLSESSTIDDAEAQKYYFKNQSEFERPKRCRFRQMRTETKVNAKQAREMLNMGKSFESMVDKYSNDPYKNRDGDTGFIDRDLLPLFLKKVCDNYKIGEISGVLESPYGFYVVMLLAREEAGTVLFEGAKKDIRAMLQCENGRPILENWLKEKKSNAIIIINEEVINEISP